MHASFYSILISVKAKKKRHLHRMLLTSPRSVEGLLGCVHAYCLPSVYVIKTEHCCLYFWELFKYLLVNSYMIFFPIIASVWTEKCPSGKLSNNHKRAGWSVRLTKSFLCLLQTNSIVMVLCRRRQQYIFLMCSLYICAWTWSSYVVRL